MRPIRLIALDLDGTLLRSDKTVSPYARSVLERLRSQGIRLVYATARPPRGVACLRLPAADGLVCHNGVLVYRDGRLESRQGLPAGVLGPLLRAFLAAQPGAHLALELGGELYANFNARELWPDSDFLPSTLLDLPPLEADKLLLDLGGGQAPLRWLEAHLPEGCYLQISEGRVAMLLNRQATKLQGVRLLLRAFGLDLRETAAFGDDLNDLELLSACGLGVAMAGALEPVKAAATAVCGPCDEDGVARFLYGLFPAQAL